MRGNLWTIEQVARLRELWAEGHTFQVIGDMMGFTKSKVCGKLCRLGLIGARPISNRRRRGAPYNDAQKAFIAANWRTRTNTEIKAVIDTLGPVRGTTALFEYRAANGMRRERFKFTPAMSLEFSRRALELRSGWPSAPNCPYDADDALCEAMENDPAFHTYREWDARRMAAYERRAA